MDLNHFDDLSAQFEATLNRLQANEKAMHNALHNPPIADTQYLSECATEASADKHLKQIASDIRNLGEYYNQIRGSLSLTKENFDSLD